MADRSSDLVSNLREVLSAFAESTRQFEGYASELALRLKKGKFEGLVDEKGEPLDLPTGHGDITMAELAEAVQAVTDILSTATPEQKEAIQLVVLR